MILYRKSVFLAVNASLRWLNNVSGVRDLEHFSGIGPCFPLAGGLCKFYANTNPLYQSTIILHFSLKD
jgi:hypothetical protein